MPGYRHNTKLTASDNLVFQFASDNGKHGYLDENGNFKAFSGGAIYLGEYSANTTIDVSALGATSADQFLAVPQSLSGTKTSHGSIPAGSWSGKAEYEKATLTLSGNTLSLTLPTVHAKSWVYDRNADDIIHPPCKVYYVGDIESAS